MPLFKIILLLLFLISIQSAYAISEGDIAPDFELKGSDGKVHALKNYKGRTVVLAWFPKAFTGGWTAECRSLRESEKALEHYKVELFMASTDEHEILKSFAEKNQAKFPILSDPTGKTAQQYGVLNFGKFASRTTFIISAEGIVLRVIRKVNPFSAGEDLLDALKILTGR